MELSKKKMAKWDDGDKKGHLYLDEDIKEKIKDFRDSLCGGPLFNNFQVKRIEERLIEGFGKELCVFGEQRSK